MRHRLGWVGRMLGGALLAAVVVDCGLRLIEATPLWRVLPIVEPILGHPDREVGFDMTPGAAGVWPRENRAPVTINSLGLRDVERPRTKAKGSLRVGLLGDSMVEAMQVSQEATFGTLAERHLVAQGHAVELLNLGQAGPSPIRQLLRLERRGYALDLDWVVANSAGGSFFSGLLLDDSENPAYVPAADGRLRRGYGFRARLSQRYGDHPLGRLFVALYQGSPLVRMLYLHGKKPWPAALGLPTAQAGVRARRGEDWTCARTQELLEPHLALWLDRRPQLEWAAKMQFLDEFAASTAERGVRVIYAVRDVPLPPSNCAHVDAQRARLIGAMQGELERRGMHFVDWTAAVAAAAGTRDLRALQGFGADRGYGHLNHEGHRVWSRTLIAVLGRESIVTDRPR